MCIVLSTLLRSGLVFVQALQVARRTTANVVLADALQQCETAIGNGRDIGEAMANTGAFPPVVVRIFSVGQQSGKLEEMLNRLAIDYDRQVTVASARLTAALEPMLILGLVVLVGFIGVATHPAAAAGGGRVLTCHAAALAKPHAADSQSDGSHEHAQTQNRPSRLHAARDDVRVRADRHPRDAGDGERAVLPDQGKAERRPGRDRFHLRGTGDVLQRERPVPRTTRRGWPYSPCGPRSSPSRC